MSIGIRIWDFGWVSEMRASNIIFYHIAKNTEVYKTGCVT
jgi:hypothetical protein